MPLTTARFSNFQIPSSRPRPTRTPPFSSNLFTSKPPFKNSLQPIHPLGIFRVQCQQTDADSEPATTTSVNSVNSEKLYGNLFEACEELRQAPPSVKQELSADILKAMEELQRAGVTQKWGKEATESLRRQNIFFGELKMMGIREPEKIAQPTVRNDFAFLVTVVGVTSVVAVAAGFLPGDWGFFVPYLTGGISLAVLAVGSTAPGLLSFFIDKFSRVFPDYRDRLVYHEAAHFLVGYLLGVPITGYSLDIGREHTDFAEAKLQRRIFMQALEDSEVDLLAIVAMGGVAAESLNFEDVVGQTADLFDLQRILNRSKSKLSDSQQQNVTRWAVYKAAAFLKSYKKEYDALMTAMRNGKSVADCVKAIEEA